MVLPVIEDRVSPLVAQCLKKLRHCVINLEDADKVKVSLCLNTKMQDRRKTGGRALDDTTRRPRHKVQLMPAADAREGIPYEKS
jgi:translation initiation factor IF-3